MEIEVRAEGAKWRWSLILSIVFINVFVPSLVLSYGVILLHSVNLGVPLWINLSTPTIFILTYNLTQCWCRDAADSWGGVTGYRVMAALGLALVVAALIICVFIPYYLHPYVYGILGGLGLSLISAQVDAVMFDTCDGRLVIVKGMGFAAQALGQSLFPHILTALIDYYGYSYSYLVLSAIMLQTLPAILLLKAEDSRRRPVSFSRYSDLAKTYAVFNDVDSTTYFTSELQLHDLNKKYWKSPSDDNSYDEDGMTGHSHKNGGIDNNIIITPPPSPEEKRRNIFGVEILPEIPEESEDSDDEVHSETSKEMSKNMRRLSVAIKRLSTLGDNFGECISNQIRRDSQTSQRDRSDSKEYSELEVTYDNISPVTDVQREKILNSFSFRVQSAYASMRRRMWMPSYRVYTLRRRLLYLYYNINDTFIKPLTRSLSSWRFYPAVLLCFSKLMLTTVFLPLLPMMAAQVQPRISMMETNFLMTLHGFAWVCFLLCTPWLVQTSKSNYKYTTVFGLIASTAACFVLSDTSTHDSVSIGCVVGGLGFGAVTSCWEVAVQDFVGVRKWPKLHSSVETLSGSLLVVFFIALSFFIGEEGGLQYCMFILGITLSIVTFIWTILAIVSLYVTKMRSLSRGRRWLF